MSVTYIEFRLIFVPDNNNKKIEIMKTYTNTVIINGQKLTNKVEAENYKEALKIQKERKAKSKNIFEGKLTLC